MIGDRPTNAALRSATISAHDGSSHPGHGRTISLEGHRADKITELLDAAGQVVQEDGHKQLTLASVVVRSGSSSRTLYRYFPDRLAILQALATRNISQFCAELSPGVTGPGTWNDGICTVIDRMLGAFRERPGFASLRFGDSLDVRPRPAQPSGIALVACEVSLALMDRFETPPDPAEFTYRVEIALTLADAMLARAFAFDANGDETLIQGAHDIPLAYLTGKFGAETSL